MKFPKRSSIICQIGEVESPTSPMIFNINSDRSASSSEECSPTPEATKALSTTLLENLCLESLSQNQALVLQAPVIQQVLHDVVAIWVLQKVWDPPRDTIQHRV
mmetsp:Transcript_116715/g.371340  ORF Transcript_116715/g.371340 Transcript_116715/m.371340 type:complete len:104 (+) Transcript_116715:318-629(+)